MNRSDGVRLVSDPRLGAVAFTGSRPGGLAMKTAADAVGKPIYLEMSSVNPVFFLPGAVAQRRGELVNELAGSCLLGSGQFCTCPNLFVLFASDAAESFIAELKSQFDSRPCGTAALGTRIGNARQIGRCRCARRVRSSSPAARRERDPDFVFKIRCCAFPAASFSTRPSDCKPRRSAMPRWPLWSTDWNKRKPWPRGWRAASPRRLYSAADGSDDSLYDALAPILRRRAGRLLNDKMPTGVAVSPAMNHGGPFPATGHPGFTAVGIPASLRRFAMLECYDNVRPQRLPAWLRDQPPNGTMWRYIDGKWMQGAAANS